MSQEGVPEPGDEAQLQRMWAGIGEGRRTRARGKARRALGTAALLSAVVAGALGFAAGTRPGPAPPAAGPLFAREGGDLGRAVEAIAERPLVLDDGSRLSAEPGTRLELVDNDARSFGLFLGQGRASFEVTPGGPRRWSIDCGVALVEVVGTAFQIERHGARVTVQVDHGVVVVRSERLPGRAKRLTAGERLEVEAEERIAPVPPPEAAAEAMPPAPGRTATRAPAKALSAAIAPAGGFIPPTTGQDAPASAPLPAPQGAAPVLAAPLPPKADPVLALIAEADRALAAGDAHAAAEVLTIVLRDHAEHSEAPVALFRLGRLELDRLNRPERAAKAFEQALARSLPKALREDALARLVEALAKSGQPGRAQETAAAYRREHPSGKRREDVERWSPQP